MIIFFIDGFMITLFLMIAVVLGYQAYLVLHGIVFVLTLIFFAAIFIFTAVILVSKATLSIQSAESKPKIVWNLLMSTLSSAISLYICYLFMQDLRVYGDGLFDMLLFAVGLFFGFIIWGFTTVGWLEALIAYPTSFSYKGFLKELIGAAIYCALVFL